jgi:uncharacterized pyridoxal phosphate-containing UPF0001 family protein
MKILKWGLIKCINTKFTISQCLVACRTKLCSELEIPMEKVELSMGMSHDYERAVTSLNDTLFMLKMILQD